MALCYLDAWSSSRIGSFLVYVLVVVGVLEASKALFRVLKGG
jgi:hypothetical protein